MSNERNIIHGPKPYHLLGKGTAGEELYEAFRRHAHLPEAMINAKTKEVLSYKTLLETTCRLAQALERCGYAQNSVISVCSENNLNFFLPVVAALYLGVIVATLNEGYTERELFNAISISKPTLIFCSQKSVKKIQQLKQKFSFIERIILLDSKDNIDGIESLDSFITSNSDANLNVANFKPCRFDPQDQVAFILCSSGTTGLPKGVMLTHYNLTVRFSHCKETTFGTQVIPATTVLLFMPFFHGFGLLTGLCYYLMGLRAVMLQRFEQELFLSSIQNYKVKSLLAAPPVVIFLAKSPLVDKYDLSSLQEIGCGAAPLGKDVIDTVTTRLNLKGIRQGYGLTESLVNVTMTPDNDFRQGSSGKVVPFMSIKVIDIETGRTLGPNQNGELCIKGGMIMKGYAENITATKEAIDEGGWLHSGDLGYYDANEHFYIVDRLKQLIKYKGFQVPPAELEALLLYHPSIKDAAVVGIPDENAGELPAAFVVKQPGKEITEQEVIDFVAGQVSSPKHLRGGVRFIQEIPKSITGKIMRKELTQLADKLKSKL